MKKILSLVLVFAMIFNLSSMTFASVTNSAVTIEKTTTNKDVVVREGTLNVDVLQGNTKGVNSSALVSGKVKFKETISKDKVINELYYNGKTEKVTSYLDKDMFTIESNGKIESYKKSDFINSPTMMATAGVTPPFGSPYTDKIVATPKTFIYNGSKIAQIKESYNWGQAEYKSFYVVAFTAVSVMVGLWE